MDLYKKILELDSVYEGEGQQPGGFTTNNPNEAIKEIVRRMFPGVTATVPISENLQLNLGPGINEISADGQFDVGGGQLSIGGGMSGDDKAFGIGFRKEFSEGTMPKIELERIQNPSEEALKEISEIIDKYTKTSVVNGQPIKHLSKEGPIDKIFKEVKTKGYKKPSIAKELFKKVLELKGITTYDNYRTNKIVFTLQDVLRKNNGDILSIKPSAVAEILPEFAIEGKKGGKGLPAFRTFLNYLEGSQRLADRSGLQVPNMIAGKPVDQIVNELKQNFLDVKGGRARGDFKVFNETKLLDRLANENPNVTPQQLKTIYEQNGGTKFKERLKNLYIAKSGQETRKTTGGKSILEGVKTGEISNKLPKSLKKSFAIYGKDYNFGRFSRFAAEETDPVKIRYYNDLANKFFTTGAQTKFGTQGLVAEHGLPISAYDRGYADISTRVKIDGYVTPEINDWKARNFDFPIFRPGGLADQYSNASMADKPKIQKQIENKLKITKLRTPNLVKNIKFDFTNGIFTASSSTPEINEKNIPNLIKQGQETTAVYNKTAGLTTADKAPIPEQAQTRKMFEDFNKRNLLPLANIGCPNKKSAGGRVNFFDGQDLTACAIKGAEKLQNTDPKDLDAVAKSNIKNLTKTAQGARFLKNVLGPGAIAFEGLFALPFAALDFAEGRKGSDILKNALSLGLMDSKLRQDELKEFFAGAGKGEEFINALESVKNISKQLSGTKKQRERAIPKYNIAFDNFQKAMQPFMRVNPQLEAGEMFSPELLEKNLRKTEDAKKDVLKTYDERLKEREIGPYAKPFDFSYGEFSNGGIAGLSGGDKSGPPPERGPDSEGLRSLMKRGINL